MPVVNKLTNWHETPVGTWWNGQIERVNLILEGHTSSLQDLRVATLHKKALLAFMAEVENKYKRGDEVKTTW